MTREFNPAETDYYIELDSEEAYPIVTIETSGETIKVDGGLVQTVETYPGETVKQIKAVDEYGLEYIYNLHFIRKASSNSYLASIKLDEEQIENYEETKFSYEIVMPYWIEDIVNLDGIKKFPNQKVVGIGQIDVSKWTTIQTIEVTSEDRIKYIYIQYSAYKTAKYKIKIFRI